MGEVMPEVMLPVNFKLKLIDVIIEMFSLRQEEASRQSLGASL